MRVHVLGHLVVGGHVGLVHVRVTTVKAWRDKGCVSTGLW